MRGVLLILSVLVAVGFGFWAYRVNYDTQAALRRVAALETAIGQERERLVVLRAEWAWLNRPERLQALVRTHSAALGLVPIAPEQFGTVADVAPPVPKEMPEGWDGIAAEDLVVTDVTPAYRGPRPQPRPVLRPTGELR
jgi:hypothetical protein